MDGLGGGDGFGSRGVGGEAIGIFITLPLTIWSMVGWTFILGELSLLPTSPTLLFIGRYLNKYHPNPNPPNPIIKPQINL